MAEGCYVERLSVGLSPSAIELYGSVVLMTITPKPSPLLSMKIIAALSTEVHRDTEDYCGTQA